MVAIGDVVEPAKLAVKYRGPWEPGQAKGVRLLYGEESDAGMPLPFMLGVPAREKE